MRIVTLFIFLLISSTEVRSAEMLLTWESIEEGEAQAEEWVNSLTESELLALGNMTQQPEELEFVRAFYPYLLPEGFFNRNMELTCYPSFLAFQSAKDQNAFKVWEQCIGELWRDDPPGLIAQALKELKP
ncbi:hypothetical protein [Methylophaga sp.]|uniref:hypothetical protein n=1 Tax=Methylophaga sp. TaxID=2024840 RepID=UPI002728B92C|nr:hypothetical protein [Methylophaga sp.]MDO8826957.1 hypothetical protein [Methylophaga sp.]